METEDHGANMAGDTGGELKFFATRGGDGNAIGCRGKLGKVKLALVVGERGNGSSSLGEKKFDAGVAERAVLAVEENDAEGGAGRVRAGGGLSERRGGDE